jgi:hypothetical protein
LYYGKVKRADACRPSVERSKTGNAKDLAEEVENLTKYFNRSPEELGEAELKVASTTSSGFCAS